MTGEDTSIGGFLAHRVKLGGNTKTLAALDKLAGKELGTTEFYSDLEEAREAIEQWMPIYVLPIGLEGGEYIGVHLRPEDVAEGHLQILVAGHDAQITCVASSLEQYVFRTLALVEGSINADGPVSGFDESVELAKGLFGTDIYEPGAHGNFRAHDVEDLMVKLFGGTPFALEEAAFGLEDPEERLRVLDRATKKFPDWLHLQAARAQTLEELGEELEAARAFARSLECYHHTAYEVDLDEHLARGRRLLSKAPDGFNQRALRDLTTRGNEERMALVMALFQEGDVEEAAKVLSDMCHDFRDYDSVLDIFREHYEKLGWDWALALVDLREGEA